MNQIATPSPMRRHYGSALLLGALLLVISFAIFVSPRSASPAAVYALPQAQQAPLCRFGVNVLGTPGSFDLPALRMGWYLDYFARANPDLLNGVEYVPVIRLSQVGQNGYTYSPSGASLLASINGNPGASWIIGNEPDRRIWQDDMGPHVYASAYHELYHLIKSADPEARIFAGAIVQPTPVRLLYLDLVLQSYLAQYGVPMPVDGWAIHNFILNEVSCDYDPANCWGAEIPPGIDWDFGEIVTIDENDDFDLFVARILRFRQWMADRGYRGLPVNLSEYAVLMPPDYGFPPSRVNAFMNDSYDYMLQARSAALGDPNDDYRLVQKWAWYSTTDNYTNGTLYDPLTFARTAIGDNFASYTAVLPNEVDLKPTGIITEPPVPFSAGEAVTITVGARIANSGNLAWPTESIIVRFFHGDPQNGGVQIGADQVTLLRGCGDYATVFITWPNLLPGRYPVYVVVDPDNLISETEEMNNTAVTTILIATERQFLPLIQRSITWQLYD